MNSEHLYSPEFRRHRCLAALGHLGRSGVTGPETVDSGCGDTLAAILHIENRSDIALATAANKATECGVIVGHGQSGRSVTVNPLAAWTVSGQGWRFIVAVGNCVAAAVIGGHSLAGKSADSSGPASDITLAIGAEGQRIGAIAMATIDDLSKHHGIALAVWSGGRPVGNAFLAIGSTRRNRQVAPLGTGALVLELPMGNDATLRTPQSRQCGVRFGLCSSQPPGPPASGLYVRSRPSGHINRSCRAPGDSSAPEKNHPHSSGVLSDE